MPGRLGSAGDPSWWGAVRWSVPRGTCVQWGEVAVGGAVCFAWMWRFGPRGSRRQAVCSTWNRSLVDGPMESTWRMFHVEHGQRLVASALHSCVFHVEHWASHPLVWRLFHVEHGRGWVRWPPPFPLNGRCSTWNIGLTSPPQIRLFHVEHGASRSIDGLLFHVEHACRHGIRDTPSGIDVSL